MDDFERDVYCLAGLPFDAIHQLTALRRIHDAALHSIPCFISTPNLNFLISAQNNQEFRESVCQSDLSLADGMPVVWMAKLLGLPLCERIAGADLFASLGDGVSSSGQKLSVFFFGGKEGVAEQACEALNRESVGLRCVGYKYPGFSKVADMSTPELIGHINASGADFLVVSLGALKGQAWIVQNRHRINAPVISHLGAVVDFVAGTVNRAPRWIQRCGFEWLWRVKEQPTLWRRYLGDAWGFLKLLLMRILPYALWLRCRINLTSIEPEIDFFHNSMGLSICLSGSLCAGKLDDLRVAFKRASELKEDVTLDLRQATYIDSAFLGLVTILRKHIIASGNALYLANVPKRLENVFYWCGMEYLLVKDR